MKPRFIICALLCTALSGCFYGCMSVPRTVITFNPDTHELQIVSPKDIEMTNIVAMVSNNVATISIQSYSSKNNMEVIKAVGNANAVQINAVAAASLKLMNEAAKSIK